MPAFAREAGCGANVPPRLLSGGGAGAAPSLDAKFQVLPRAVIAPRPCRGFFSDASPAAMARVSRRPMLRCSKSMASSPPASRAFLRPQAHRAAPARISSTGCSSCRDAGRLLLTCLVRSVYVQEGRDGACGRTADMTTKHGDPRHPSGDHRTHDGALAVCTRSAAIRSGDTDAAGRRRRPDGHIHPCVTDFIFLRGSSIDA